MQRLFKPPSKEKAVSEGKYYLEEDLIANVGMEPSDKAERDEARPIILSRVEVDCSQCCTQISFEQAQLSIRGLELEVLKWEQKYVASHVQYAKLCEKHGEDIALFQKERDSLAQSLYAGALICKENDERIEEMENKYSWMIEWDRVQQLLIDQYSKTIESQAATIKAMRETLEKINLNYPEYAQNAGRAARDVLEQYP